MPLKEALEKIYNDDQLVRLEVMEIRKKLGNNTKEEADKWKTQSIIDSINLIKVKSIIDMYGWIGTDIVGPANNALYIVIQHSDQTTQEKYLPMMRESVRKGKSSGSNLAYLEDRVALGQNKYQIYGTQIGKDELTKAYYFAPTIDPDNLDKRRVEVGLGLIADYLNNWGIKWNLEQYKKDLPTLEKKYFKKK